MRLRSSLLVIALVAAAFLVTPHAQQPSSASGKMETYYYYVFNNPAEGQEAEYNRYYDNQHSVDVTAVPGFMEGQRYILADTQLSGDTPPSKYVVVYTVVTDNLPAVQAEVSRRIASKETFINPVMVGAQNSPGGYYKTLAPIMPRKGGSASSGSEAATYYQFEFSNSAPGKESEFHTWSDKTHIADWLTMPGWMEAQRGQLMNPRERPGVTTYNYLTRFKIVTDNLSAAQAAYRQASSRATNPAVAQSVSFTYKVFGPVHYGDQIRAWRRAQAQQTK